MGDSTTIALNLTFFGTLGLAFLMFLGLFLLVVATLVLAGVGRLMVLTVLALFGRLPKHESLPLVRLTGEQGTPSHDDDAAPSSAKPPRAGVLRARALRAKAAALRAKAAALRAKAAALRARTRAALSKARARCRAAFSMAAAWCSAMTAALLAPRDWRQAARNGRDLLKPSEFRPRLREAVEHHPLLTAARREQPVL
ncbi:MAG: hypothetical protein WAL27_11395, partial [Cellulosimicrobium cellulans]